jgi:hypothetical protein
VVVAATGAAEAPDAQGAARKTAIASTRATSRNGLSK